MSDTAVRPTLLQRVVIWILNALMFYFVVLYPIYLMATFQPDSVVHYGFLRWLAVVFILYWAAMQLFFTERPAETRWGRMLLAITAAILLVAGAFMPIVWFPFVGSVDYLRDGYGDGYILLIMAGLSLALAVTGRWKQVMVPALGSLAMILWTFLSVQDTISHARAGVAAELVGNPYQGLAASVMQSIQWQWGWVVLFAGSGLLVYSAVKRDRPRAESPPLTSVTVEDEPEAVPAAEESRTATAAETAEEPGAAGTAQDTAATTAEPETAGAPPKEPAAPAETAGEPTKESAAGAFESTTGTPAEESGAPAEKKPAAPPVEAAPASAPAPAPAQPEAQAAAEEAPAAPAEPAAAQPEAQAATEEAPAAPAEPAAAAANDEPVASASGPAAGNR